jgi:hypothetical protein
MKAFIFLLCTALAAGLTAQNWNPILVNEKMNYRHSDSAYISNTVWVDSSFLLGVDSVFYLNRIVKDVPGYPEIVLRNQPQFLLKQMLISFPGSFTFSNPESFVINVLANTGETWIFDQENNIIAQVISESVENIFGIQDSIKWISLSDGNEIRLSKSFGLLKFPDFENDGYYELVGIQNTEYGESVPDFWDIFDFDIGDVFQYGGFGSNIDFTIYWTRKITIISKEINYNNLTYNFEGIYHAFGYDNIFPPDPFEVGYPISGSQAYTDSLNHLANKYQNQLNVFPNSFSSYGFGKVFTVARLMIDIETNLVSKQFGLHYDENEVDGRLFYELVDNSDTLHAYNTPFLIEEPGPMKGIIYKAHLGEIYTAEGFFEYEATMELEGYIKDSDTIGTITPDSLLLVNVIESSAVNRKVLVYPNPTNKSINLRFTEVNNEADEISIEIRNLQGQLLMHQAGIASETVTLDVEKLSQGIYICIIKNKENIIQQEKLVIY